MAYSSGTMGLKVPKDDTEASKANEGHNDEAQVGLGHPRDSPNLKRKLKSRHLQMIAIGEWSIFPLHMTILLI
jgi:amino acid permease